MAVYATRRANQATTAMTKTKHKITTAKTATLPCAFSVRLYYVSTGEINKYSTMCVCECVATLCQYYTISENQADCTQ